ncbi:putative metalloprotease CJM1_0395 family protein [Alteromonas lipolytica]|uniref:Catalase n=1 Tax=Alteromonas lipolytica TaxID=1856405 RepID=A0A1E8FAW0_9ALTE|nr:putative metalloprotease CJM1_0395 family protein [Alteromonas lipolytica]OFI33051.1 hypothetical protein BFC17_01910 [Alteromonas lipolytica]GGF62980.1 hypothetical protein GCM10011338_14250 [Alteromonas lipolytica]
MNIVTPIPTSFAIPTANLSVEAARRDNLVRDTIPQPADAKQGSAEQGLGSESDKLKSSVKGNQPLTYERLQNNQGGAQTAAESDQQFNNANEESAGKDDARDRQQQQSEQRQIDMLQQRDQEVRAHEQAHASIGGQYAGSPQYEFQRGPDGQRYAVEGQVSIDVSTENTPQQTIRKMQQVRAAALAPAEPSPQDLQVAAEASRIAFEARNKLADERSEATAAPADEAQTSTARVQVPTLEEIVANNQPQIPTRKLDELAVEDDDRYSQSSGRRSLQIDTQQMQQRNAVIASFYKNVSTPFEGGFSASA